MVSAVAEIRRQFWKIVWERKKYQVYTVCRAFDPNYVQSLLNLWIKTLKHSIFSTKMPHWHHFLWFIMICALLLRNFLLQFRHFFPQIFWNWKAQSADFIVFRMYGDDDDELVKTKLGVLLEKRRQQTFSRGSDTGRLNQQEANCSRWQIGRKPTSHQTRAPSQ